MILCVLMRHLRLGHVGAALWVLAGCALRDPLGDATDSQGTASTSDAATTGSPTSDAPPTTSPTTTGPSPTTTGPTGGDPTDSASVGETFCPCSCGEAIVDVRIAPVDVVFVLDKSGSMDNVPGGFWDHDADDLDLDGQSDFDPEQNMPATPEVSRWESLRRVAEGTLNTFDRSLNAGLSLFPSRDATNAFTLEGACPVEVPIEVAIEPNHAQAILEVLPPATGGKLAGGTPASLAIAATVSALAAGDPAHARHIIYVTDGAAQCNGDAPEAFETYDETLHDQVVQALAVDTITSHIIGIEIEDVTSPVVLDGQPDAVNNHDRLNELATQGGAPRSGPEKFFNANTEEQLRAAFEEIVRDALPCTVVLEPPPHFPDTVEIRVNDVDYGKASVTDCAAESGWRYLEPGRSIELCGTACLDFQSAGSLDAQYRCGDSDCC